MKVNSIHIYPIKSLGGVSLQSSSVHWRGLEFDRRWMLVDKDGKFITQRKYPKLTLFSIKVFDDHLLVSSKQGGDSFSIPFIPNGAKLSVKVWDDSVNAVEVAKEVSDWFSLQLEEHVKLVYMPDDSKRLIDTKYASNSELVNFADGYPLLLANSASLDDLNDRLEKEIYIDRFRPNIVVGGTFPFEEDEWKNISIGDSAIEVVKKCARCVMVNIDPSTSKKSKDVLQVLSTYRNKNNKVYFGVNALIHKTGIIKVGDELIFS